MQDRSRNRWDDDLLVLCDVEPNSRPSGHAKRPLIAYSTLERRAVERVVLGLDHYLGRIESEATQLLRALGKITQCARNGGGIVGRRRQEREVEIFRETIGFKEALLHARSALENPNV